MTTRFHTHRPVVMQNDLELTVDTKRDLELFYMAGGPRR